jgi:hypothetical protein
MAHKPVEKMEISYLDSSIDCMKENLEKLENQNAPERDLETKPPAKIEQRGEGKAQLAFIRKLISDIDKLTSVIVDKSYRHRL